MRTKSAATVLTIQMHEYEWGDSEKKLYISLSEESIYYTPKLMFEPAH